MVQCTERGTKSPSTNTPVTIPPSSTKSSRSSPHDLDGKKKDETLACTRFEEQTPKEGFATGSRNKKELNCSPSPGSSSLLLFFLQAPRAGTRVLPRKNHHVCWRHC